MKEQVGLSLDSLKERLVSFSVRHIYGIEKIKFSEEEVIVLCLVKNGEHYIEEFIKHYFKLGVKHIIFLDNKSEDNTLEFVKQYGKEKVSIFETNFYFGNNNDMRMRNYLIDRFAKDRWSLCVDIDEFFDYPFSDMISLEDLIMYLNKNEYNAFSTPLLDMFPEKIVNGWKRKFIKEEHKYYSSLDIKKEDYLFTGDVKNKIDGDIKIYKGGIRKTLFNFNPMLTKHALIFNDVDVVRDRFGHLLFKGRIADIGGCLFHYKFTDEFFDYVKDAVEKEYHYKNSKEYKEYFSILNGKSTFDFKTYCVKKLKNKNDLIGEGFFVISSDYLKFIDNIGGAHQIRDYLKIERIKNKGPIEVNFNRKEDVSVLIAYKNRDLHMLEDCLKSIRFQDYNQNLIKIVIVDYGSEDSISNDLKILCEQYNARHLLIKGFEEWSKPHAFNIGIKAIDTKYTLISDSDLVFEKNYISECIKEMQKNVFQVLFTKIWDCPKELGLGKIDPIKDFYRIKDKCILREKVKENDLHIYGSSICFTLSYFFKVIRGYDENLLLYYAEDTDIIKRFQLMSLCIKDISDRTSFIHQWHPKFEGMNVEKFNVQVDKNQEYVRFNDSILRNSRGWGEIKMRGNLNSNSKEREDVAVIIGVRNRLDYRLENAFKTIRNQDYDQDLIKIILIDYGSDSHYVHPLKELCDKYDAIYIRVDNVRVWNRSHALNIGIKKAKTKYVLCSDVDIIFKNNYITECIRELENNLNQVLFCTMRPLLSEKPIQEFDVIENFNDLVNRSVFQNVVENCYKFIFGTSIIFVLREWFYEINGYDETYCLWGAEDEDLIKRFKMIKLNMKNMDDKTIHLHQWHPKYEGLTNNDKKQIEKNKEYFFKTNTVLRNKTGWGEILSGSGEFVDNLKKDEINKLKIDFPKNCDYYISDELIGKNKDYSKFIILNEIRSGSNLLKTLLNSHKNAFCFSEIFSPYCSNVFNGAFKNTEKLNLIRDKYPIKFLENMVFSGYKSDINAVGIKIIYNHFVEFELIKNYLKENNIKIIHLRRKNLLKAFLSLKKANKSGIWFSEGKLKENKSIDFIRLDYEDCLKFFEETSKKIKYFDDFYKNKINIFYEDLIKNREFELKKIQVFLGLEVQKLEANLVKQETKSISDSILNYYELKEKFKGSKWEVFFED